MPSRSPVVSIILTSYNYAQYIGQTIASVLEQSYSDWELIVVDDGSDDNSVEVIRSFDDDRITLIASESNQGATIAYNTAYAQCRGKYVCSLDSDDAIAREKFSRQVEFLEQNPDVDICGTNVVEIDATGKPTGDRNHSESWFNKEIDFNVPENWIWQNHLCHSSVLMRKATHDRVGKFNTALVYMPDYEFWLRCFVRGAKFAMLREPLTCYRYHENNITRKNPQRFYEEYAFAFCVIMKSFLVNSQRLDLLTKGIYGFVTHPSYGSFGEDVCANLLQKLFSSSVAKTPFAAFLSGLQESPSMEAKLAESLFGTFGERAHHLQSYNEELVATNHQMQVKLLEANDLVHDTKKSKLEAEESRNWFEEQYNSWRGIAEDREKTILQQKSWIAEVEKAKLWFEDTIRGQKEWIDKLTASKDWLEGQRDQWETLAKSREKMLTEQKQWGAELQKAKEWLESQKLSLEKHSLQQGKIIQEQIAWIAELESSKGWLSAQWTTWRDIANTREKAIDEQKNWIETLENGKLWLENQLESMNGILKERERQLQEYERLITVWTNSRWGRLGLRLGFVHRTAKKE